MSDFEEYIGDLLAEAFSQATIKPQFTVNYMNQLLFFDFYIPALNLLVECQGEQHYKYVPYFHGSKAEYKLHVQRDALKREWAKQQKITLYEIPFNKRPKSAAQLFNEIYEELELE
jgi:hypothetical protein